MPPDAPTTVPLLDGEVRVLVRGWLHGNCLIARSGDLVDTGYHTGTGALRRAIADHAGSVAVGDILLTHVHSDHAGGVAAFEGARVRAHRDAAAMVQPWDSEGLWLDATGQELPRFGVDAVLDAGDEVSFADRSWRVVHTPGHATGGVSFFCEAEGVVVTGDALWRDGLGLLDPWIDGPDVHDHAADALDRLASTGARVVVPGHGPPFADLPGAVERARSRLAYWRDRPDRLLVHVLKSGVVFWRLANPHATGEQALAQLSHAARAHDAPSAAVREVWTSTRPG